MSTPARRAKLVSFVVLGAVAVVLAWSAQAWAIVAPGVVITAIAIATAVRGWNASPPSTSAVPIRGVSDVGPRQSGGWAGGRPVTPVSIRPRKDECREPFILKVSTPGWFKTGGFTVSDDGTLRVRTWGGRMRSCRADEVAAVILTRCLGGRVPDWRVLVTDGTGRVLLKDVGLFYTDHDLRVLTEAIGCAFRGEQFSRFVDLENAHPGALASRSLAHPYRLGLALSAAIFVVILLVVGVASVLGH